MKLQNIFFASALTVFALSSCTKENEFDGQSDDTSNAIEFASSITGGASETRLDGTSWAGGEAVGVFMLDASTSAFSISDNGTNKEYTGQADGSLAPKSGALSFPQDKSEVRFMAYYPYQKSADAGMYTIDLTKDGDNDLLFASAPTAYSAVSEGTVNLAFSHKLSKMQLTLANDISGAAIDASKVTMRAEMRTAGTFSLKTQEGELTIGDAVSEVSMPVVAVSGKAVGSVIVFPTVEQSNGASTTTLNSISKLIFNVDGKEYVCDDATLLAGLVANNQYNFDVVLSEDAKAIVSLTSTIQAWSVVDKGTLVATPTDGDDSGDTGGDTGTTTGQTIAEARALAPADGESVVIAQEMTVTGSVIAQNDPSSSFYKAVIISDGAAALYIYDETTANMTFAIGDEVTVDLNGATLKNYNGLIEAMSTGTDYALSAKITKTGNTKVIEPKVVSAADLANYQSMLVTIKEATAPAGSTTWGSAEENTTIEMSSSTGAFNVYTSKFSNFKTEAVPAGTGDVTGIVGWYKAPQIIFASTDGWAGMTGTSTGGDTGGDTGNTGGDTGGDTGNTGGDTGSTTTDVVTFPVTFDLTADASNGSGIFPGSGANSMATIQTYGAAAFTYTAGSGDYPGYIVAKGFTTESGWNFTLPVKDLAAGATVNFVGTMRSSNTAPGNYAIAYSVDGGTNFVATSTTIELAGSADYHDINTDITIAEGLASGNLVIRFAVSGTTSAGIIADSAYSNPEFKETGTNRWANGSVVISLK